MKTIIIISALLFSKTIGFAQYTITDFQKLYVFIGQWERDIKKGMTHEFWDKKNETSLLSKALSINGKDTILKETVELTLQGHEVFYTVTALGQNDNKPVSFKLTKIENKTFIFENPGHDFPQKIIYDFKSNDQLQASVEGTINGKIQRIDFNFRRLGVEKPLKISLGEVLQNIPGKKGERFASGMRNGTMRLLLYAPRGKDDQQPHKQDEVYIIVKGKGSFVCGERSVDFVPNDVLFVPAGVIHYFENFSDDLQAWVVFYGPEGGEK